MILFGWGKQTESIKARISTLCRNCQQQRNYLCVCRRTWFTLFFIPIIPYKTQYLIYCEGCHNGQEVSAEQFAQVLQQSLGTAA